MSTEIIAVPPNYTNTYLIVGIILLVFLIFIIALVWKQYREDPQVQVYLDCPIGSCATNIYNGSKRCLSDDTMKVVIDPQYEVCSSKFLCDSVTLPYAVNSDGSSNDFGICEEGLICRCSNRPSCAIDDLVLFTANNGSIYSDDIDNSNLTFSQTSVGPQGDPVSIKYVNPNNQFCSLNLNYFDRVSPGTCIFNSNTAITLNEAVRCVRLNPCINGVLAFQPSDINDFVLTTTNTDSIYSTPVGCVPGLITNGLSGDCIFNNQVPVWDRNQGKIICYDTI